jgi:hypothetical protein
MARARGPHEFRLRANPTKKCRNRRLPGMTQREAFTAGSDPFTPGRRACELFGTFPGAACSYPFRPD